jgi:2C-methyl-D-erythritol 2,4-cyclodiphosphate synthase
MRSRLPPFINLPPDRSGIKAVSWQLDAVGREEAIVAHAVVLLLEQ